MGAGIETIFDIGGDDHDRAEASNSNDVPPSIIK